MTLHRAYTIFQNVDMISWTRSAVQGLTHSGPVMSYDIRELGHHWSKRTNSEPCVIQVVNLRTNIVHQFWYPCTNGYQIWWPNFGYQIWFCTRLFIKDVFTFCIISWILFNRRRPNSQWSKNTYCLSSYVLLIQCLVVMSSLRPEPSLS